MIRIVKIIYRPQFVLSRIAKKTIVTKKCTARKHAKPVQVSDIFILLPLLLLITETLQF